MSIFSMVGAIFGRKGAKPVPRPPEEYIAMTPAELKEAAMAGDYNAEAELRRRAYPPKQ